MLRRRVARRILHGLRRPFVLRRTARAAEVLLLGCRFRTDPAVFHPLYFSSSSILAKQVLAQSVRGLRVLDMGTGAGPIAVAAASAGAQVTACDINPRAVALARENSALNGLNSEIVESDLFAELSDRQFDLICFNLPFYARDPVTPLDAAFNAGCHLETVRRFALGCTHHLDVGGRVLVLFSEDCDTERILRAFRETGFTLESTRVTRSLLEDFHVVCFRSQV